jgi:hypothetical protein
VEERISELEVRTMEVIKSEGCREREIDGGRQRRQERKKGRGKKKRREERGKEGRERRKVNRD